MNQSRIPSTSSILKTLKHPESLKSLRIKLNHFESVGQFHFILKKSNLTRYDASKGKQIAQGVIWGNTRMLQVVNLIHPIWKSSFWEKGSFWGAGTF